MAQERQPPEGQTREIGSVLKVVSASNAAIVDNNGNANNNTASYANYVAAINLCALVLFKSLTRGNITDAKED